MKKLKLFFLDTVSLKLTWICVAVIFLLAIGTVIWFWRPKRRDISRRNRQNIEPKEEREPTAVKYSVESKSVYLENWRCADYSDTDSGEFVSAGSIIPPPVEFHEKKSTQDRGNQTIITELCESASSEDIEDHSTSLAATGDSDIVIHNAGNSETSGGGGAAGGGNSTEGYAVGGGKSEGLDF